MDEKLFKKKILTFLKTENRVTEVKDFLFSVFQDKGYNLEDLELMENGDLLNIMNSDSVKRKGKGFKQRGYMSVLDSIIAHD